jgi:hypothetical protein
MAKSQPFPVRCLNNEWQVLIAGRDTWLTCANETDARLIAKSQMLWEDGAEGIRHGAEFADELDSVAEALERYLPCYCARALRHRAEDARKRP